MIPFPGESLPLDFILDDVGSSAIYNDVLLRGPRIPSADGHRVIASGEAWHAWVDPSFSVTYLEEDTLDVDVWWVVEVLSGSGTLAGRDGTDAAYDYDPDATLPRDLGSVAVSGAGTYLFPTSFTASQIVNGDDGAFAFRLECTAGSIDVQQVKLRVWPIGGAHGAFVDQPGFDTAPVLAGVRVTTDTETGHAGVAVDTDVETSWDAAAASLVTDTNAPPYTFTPASLSGHYSTGAQFAGSQSNLDGTNLQTTLSLSPSVGMVTGRDWRTAGHVAPGVTGYTRPPEEVRGEVDAYLYPQTGTGSTGWVDAGVVIVQTGQDAASVPAITFVAHSGDAPDITPSGGSLIVDVPVDETGDAITAPAEGSTVTSSHALPTDALYLFAHVSHTGALTPAGWPGTSPGSPLDAAVVTGIDAQIHFGVGDPDGDFSPIQTFAHMPAYQVWMPDAVAELVGIVRHWPRNDGRRGTSPSRIRQQTSQQSGRGAGYS